MARWIFFIRVNFLFWVEFGLKVNIGLFGESCYDIFKISFR